MNESIKLMNIKKYITLFLVLFLITTTSEGCNASKECNEKDKTKSYYDNDKGIENSIDSDKITEHKTGTESNSEINNHANTSPNPTISTTSPAEIESLADQVFSYIKTFPAFEFKKYEKENPYHSGNHANFALLCSDDKWIYYIDINGDGFLYKASIDGEYKEQLLDKECNYLQLYNGYLYFIDSETLLLNKMSLETKEVAVFLDIRISSYYIMNEYIIMNTGIQLIRVSMDAVDIQVIVETGDFDIFCIAPYQNYIIYQPAVSKDIKNLLKEKLIIAVDINTGQQYYLGEGMFKPVISADVLYYHDMTTNYLCGINMETGKIFKAALQTSHPIEMNGDLYLILSKFGGYFFCKFNLFEFLEYTEGSGNNDNQDNQDIPGMEVLFQRDFIIDDSLENITNIYACAGKIFYIIHSEKSNKNILYYYDIQKNEEGIW